MSKDIKYRIAEYQGVFRIEIYAWEIKGILWWKKTIWSWEQTNYWGGVRQQTYPVLEPQSKAFTSLEDAKQQIALFVQFKKKAVYHLV